MRGLEDNYFIKRLEKGIDTSIMLMVHNAYWSEFMVLERKFNNFHAYLFGGRTADALYREEDIPKDCDFILLDGSNYFSEIEMNITKKIALEISEKNNKRVTIGYVYFIPIEQRTNPNISKEIRIISIKNNVLDEETISIEGNHNIMFFVDVIAKEHSELETQKVLKKM